MARPRKRKKPQNPIEQENEELKRMGYTDQGLTNPLEDEDGESTEEQKNQDAA